MILLDKWSISAFTLEVRQYSPSTQSYSNKKTKIHFMLMQRAEIASQTPLVVVQPTKLTCGVRCTSLQAANIHQRTYDSKDSDSKHASSRTSTSLIHRKTQIFLNAIPRKSQILNLLECATTEYLIKSLMKHFKEVLTVLSLTIT